MASFQARLQKLRTQRSLTQAELARRLGVQRSIVSNYEHGLALPPLPMLVKLAKALAVSLDHLVFDDKNPEQLVKDRELLQLFGQADNLNLTAKAALKEVIEGLIAKAKTSEHAGQQER